MELILNPIKARELGYKITDNPWEKGTEEYDFWREVWWQAEIEEREAGVSLKNLWSKYGKPMPFSPSKGKASDEYWQREYDNLFKGYKG